MVLDGPGCKLVRREPLEARVGAVLVEVVSPLGQQLAHMCQRAERGLVQTARRAAGRLKLSTNAFWIGLPGWM